MPYYPILKYPGSTGWVTLCNFPPNDWELTVTQELIINVTWPEKNFWISKNIGMLAPGALKTISINDLPDLAHVNSLVLLSLSHVSLPEKSDFLPKIDFSETSIPAWRATLGLSTLYAQTSYQGELNPFPPQGTLLTFGPFLQFGNGIKNDLIFLNLEKSPLSRISVLEIYNSATQELKGVEDVHTNKANLIELDKYGFIQNDLPLYICRGMAGIPLYVSRTVDGEHLSMEHTHPPASLVVHGERWEVQKFLKNRWFSRV
jgi:hypothetical protein